MRLMHLSVYALFFQIVLTNLNATDSEPPRLNLEELDKINYRVEVNMQEREFDNEYLLLLLDNCPTRLKNLLDLSYVDFFNLFPKVSLLIGEPGVGKSTLARAISVLFCTKYEFIKCSTLATEYRNSGVQSLERLAKKMLLETHPHIIIFDEINIIAEKHHNPHDTDRDMGAALWQLIDQLEKTPHKIIATANSIDKLPDPIKDRFLQGIFHIAPPTKKQREAIIKYHLDKQKIRYCPEIIPLLANQTNYLSGRLLKSLTQIMTQYTLFRVVRNQNTPNRITSQDAQNALKEIEENIKLSHYTQKQSFFGKLWANYFQYEPRILTFINLGVSLASLYFSYKQLMHNTTITSKSTL